MSKKEDSIENLTKELSSFLIKAKGEVSRLKTENKKANEFKQLTKAEYHKLYEENQKLHQKIKQYKQYFKSQNIQKKGAARAKEDLEHSKKRKKKWKSFSFWKK